MLILQNYLVTAVSPSKKELEYGKFSIWEYSQSQNTGDHCCDLNYLYPTLSVNYTWSLSVHIKISYMNELYLQL